jgi:hypothetical protein
MDTSELYIKMSDCPEIQGEWTIPPYDHDFCWNDEYKFLTYGRDIKGKDVDEYIWLPRQDQIQEMMPECKCPCCLIVHLNKFVADNIDGFADRGIDSMEQYWLAFYMSEKHQKFWGKDGWEDV